ncbi:winged helix-turn-helix domain-containing protein [Actinacidiphila glaucinigra]|uniref:Helix-turn-helix domain-containing protein n=1 Tax=Actinacidiphila glaucinigra TaxID=235986 RepID=A0A239J1Z2_9ACTN|nr:winged helix-turn-helix domain-containing protein [Actinacidiphila glaucinigra]SNS99283.1 Helix-turn-helix domain-containing protein [Actinacidiphila glaucinigra]
MPDEPAAGAPDPGVISLDPRTLRGLAHPLRIRLLAALREYGPATASGLAGRLGESSGATSYHLRQLAAYGFVEEDPGRGTARERWWKAAHSGTRFNAAGFLAHADPEVRAAIGLLGREVAATHAAELETWLATVGDWPEEWRRSFDLSDFALRLTPAGARALREELHAVVERYRTRQDAEPETAGDTAEAGETAHVRVHLHTFPRAAD